MHSLHLKSVHPHKFLNELNYRNDRFKSVGFLTIQVIDKSFFRIMSSFSYSETTNTFFLDFFEKSMNLFLRY